jgi:predicted dehydrogenase
MVGFNRRFAPLTQELIRKTGGRAGPLSLVITVNAGSLPDDHWTHDGDIGGGRFAGEACHFIDLARAIIGAPIRRAHCVAARRHDGKSLDDVAHVALEFAEGSTGAIHYLATGARAFPKERVEAFVDGKTYVIDNWRRLKQFGASLPLPSVRPWLSAVRGDTAAPIPLDELMEVSRWTLRLAQEARGRGGE